MKSRAFTHDILLRLLLLDSGGLHERGQGVLLLIEGGLRVPHDDLLLLEGFALLLEGPGERGDGRLLALELGLLALELGLFLLEHRPNALQLGSLRLSLLSFLLCRGPLDVALFGDPR